MTSALTCRVCAAATRAAGWSPHAAQHLRSQVRSLRSAPTCMAGSVPYELDDLHVGRAVSQPDTEARYFRGRFYGLGSWSSEGEHSPSSLMVTISPPTGRQRESQLAANSRRRRAGPSRRQRVLRERELTTARPGCPVSDGGLLPDCSLRVRAAAFIPPPAGYLIAPAPPHPSTEITRTRRQTSAFQPL